MKKLLDRTILAMKESNDMGKLLTLSEEERALVVYAEDSFSYVQLKGYLNALWANHGIAYQYVTSDPGDPLLGSPPLGATVWYIKDQLARMMGSLDCGVFLTTMPDLGQFHVPRPRSGKTVYVFHSLNSTHTAYRTGAFDNYDQFFCTGPHHVEELSRLRSGTLPELSEVGYPKLDQIRAEHEEWLSGGRVENDVVLLAPSWGQENLLEAHGTEIIASLLGEGLRVIVRPHPQFFHSLYPEGAGVIENLQREFGRQDSVEFELNINTQDSFHRSALMISDWSGAAYEYALGTLRPVLFVDTPQKIFNPDWEKVGLPSFERAMREKVGTVIDRIDTAQVGPLAIRTVAGDLEADSELARVAGTTVFNPGVSATAGAEALWRAIMRA
jgi:hypothetical protein